MKSETPTPTRAPDSQFSTVQDLTIVYLKHQFTKFMRLGVGDSYILSMTGGLRQQVPAERRERLGSRIKLKLRIIIIIIMIMIMIHMM